MGDTIMKSISVPLSMSLILLLTGCFAKIHSLPAHPDKNSPVFAPLPDRETLVGIAISGGGSRAATFAAGALEALANIRITESGQPHSVLEKVTHMSSVSGGSLATAYYALKKPSKSEPVLSGQGLSPIYERFFSAFQSDMQLNFQGRALARQFLNFRAFNPTKSAYSFAEVWDANFFHDATFSDLYEREENGDAPQVIFNGTIYNSGRRLVLTTLPPSDFSTDFVDELRTKMTAKRTPRSSEENTRFEKSLRQFTPQTFEGLKADHRNLPVSLAVATSASFPPVAGPVTYQAEGTGPYTHVGDGGLFDNLGTESLTTLFLNKLLSSRAISKKALIFVNDASYPFDEGNTNLDLDEKGYEVFLDNPSRIVGIMEERANAYQVLLWHSLRTENAVLPDSEHLKFIFLRHTEAEWTKDDPIPTACPNTLTPEEIGKTIRQIPTLFKIKEPCHGALLIAAAHKVVHKQRQGIVDFLQTAP